jgi:hypothetical protein
MAEDQQDIQGMLTLREVAVLEMRAGVSRMWPNSISVLNW